MAHRHLPRNVVALAAVSFFTDASSEMIAPLLPVFVASTLGAGAMAVGFVEGLAQAVASLVQVVSGQWSDRLGRRKPLIVAGYGLASVLRPLVGLTTGVGQVVAIRVGDRIGKGMRGAPRDALIADSVDPATRGQAFGVHRAADHAGAVMGPAIAFVLLRAFGLGVREVFLLAAIPAACAMIVAVWFVREVPRAPEAERSAPMDARSGVGRWPTGTLGRYLAVLALFTLGNSTDAFLLLRAQEAGVRIAHLPLLWAELHVVKSLASGPGGSLSDRVGRKPLLVTGWVVYAAVYLGFGQVTSVLGMWGLMAVYGVYHGLTEGTEKALVADLVPPERRGWAYGWFHLSLGLTALPASVLFGAVWAWAGAKVAFGMGAGVALAAALLLLAIPLADSARRPA